METEAMSNPQRAELAVGSEMDTVRFGDFELEFCRGDLKHKGTPVSLRPQAATVLVLLVRNAGRVVSRTDLRRVLWQEAHVESDLAINQIIRQIRAALGDDGREQRYIETLAKRGYRFRAPVSVGAVESAYPAPHGRRWGYFGAGMLTAFGLPILFLLLCILLAFN